MSGERKDSGRPSPQVEAARARWSHRGGGRPAFAHEPGPGQRSVWDFPRPPAFEAVPEPVRVLAGEVELAHTEGAIRVLETGGAPTYYVAPADVELARLAPAEGHSFCEWKGEASYWRLADAEEGAAPVAWSYPAPFAEFERLRGWLSFYPARVACYVGDLRAEPQPGGFYGGWVTPDLAGPIKGEPGTEGL